MKKSALSIFISTSIGSVSSETMEPKNMKAAVVLAHGAGAGMHHPFMIELSKALADLEVGTLRFNFPFTEQKKKRPDVPAVAHKTIEVVIQKAKELFPQTPIFTGGKSFGGRMTSQYLAKQNESGIHGIIFFGFPLHPAGKPSIERASHLQEVKIPMLFLQGTRDTLAQWDLIESVTTSLPLATLVRFEGADHSFKVGRQNIIPDLAAAVKKWVSD